MEGLGEGCIWGQGEANTVRTVGVMDGGWYIIVSRNTVIAIHTYTPYSVRTHARTTPSITSSPSYFVQPARAPTVSTADQHHSAHRSVHTRDISSALHLGHTTPIHIYLALSTFLFANPCG